MANDIAKQDDFDMGIDFSDLMMIIMMVIMMSILPTITAATAATTAATQAIGVTAQQIQSQGRNDPRKVHATTKLQWIDLIHELPKTPWVHAYIVNDGPYAVEIGINYPNDRFFIYPGGQVTLDHSNKPEGIGIIYYICPMYDAYVRIIGEY